MEYQNGVRNASDLDQFASVALLDAAMHTTSPVLPGSVSHENRIVLDAEGFSGFSPCDDYTDDPRFLESQREFRDLLPTSAQSLAPTRASSPVEQCGINHHNSKTLFDSSVIKQTVSSRERVVWLRKYHDEVAPWVHNSPFMKHSSLTDIARHV